MGALTKRTLKTIHTLLSCVRDSQIIGHVSAGWVPECNMFDASPLSVGEAAEMNKEHDERIEVKLSIVGRLLLGEQVPTYLDSDF